MLDPAKNVLNGDPGPPIGPPSTNRVITRSATPPTGTGASSGAPVVDGTPPPIKISAPRAGTRPQPRRSSRPLTRPGQRNLCPRGEARHAKYRNSRSRGCNQNDRDARDGFGSRTQQTSRPSNSAWGERAPTGALLSGSPPVPRSRSASDASRDVDITELYHRVREVRAVADDSVSDAAEITERVLALERQPVSSAQDAELGARVSALEDRAAPSGALTADALSTAVALRFGEIAGDRDALDAAMHVQFEAQTTANAQLRLEIIDLRKTLAAVQTTLPRLELGGRSQPRAEPAARSVTHPPPACSHAPAPRHARAPLRTTGRQSAPADCKAS
ncbi:hypothetical protein B0H14DRAFT_2567314 [Mycena olivaceomarginata]|nr:hypothetical protein B0H14DRAFT_2567314 [Mycena olivaceomarginata]